MDGDGSLLSELFLRLVNLSDEVDETFAGLRHPLLRPVRELEGDEAQDYELRMPELYWINTGGNVHCLCCL